MTGYLSVGVSFTFAVIGLVVGIYFLSRAWKYRKTVDTMTVTFFSAIGTAAISEAIVRISVLPNYFGRATGIMTIQRLFSDFSWVTVTFLAVAAWAYLLHLKPLFYSISFLRWLLLTAAIVALLIIGATALAHSLGELVILSTVV